MAAALPGDKNQKEIIQLLLEHGADPSIRNLDNDQPIHMAPPGKAGDQVWSHAAALPCTLQEWLGLMLAGIKIFLIYLGVCLVAHVNDCVCVSVLGGSDGAS